MPKRYSSLEIEIVISKLGFVFTNQRGSHKKFKNNKGLTCILPANKNEIPVGTFRSILRQIQVSADEFDKFANN